MEFCELGEVEKQMLKEVAGLYATPEGAYNFRINGKSVSRKSSSNIDVDIVDGGLVITVKPGTKRESVHIPVVLSKTGLKETVRNTFNIGDGADVLIIAGCGIYNCGTSDSEQSHILYKI